MKEQIEDKILHYKYILYVLQYSQDTRQEETVRFINGEISECERELKRLKGSYSES